MCVAFYFRRQRFGVFLPGYITYGRSLWDKKKVVFIKCDDYVMDVKSEESS